MEGAGVFRYWRNLHVWQKWAVIWVAGFVIGVLIHDGTNEEEATAYLAGALFGAVMFALWKEGEWKKKSEEEDEAAIKSWEEKQREREAE